MVSAEQPKKKYNLKEYQAAYRAAHREEIREKSRAYRLAHPDKCKAYRDEHREKHKEYTKAWYAKNRDAIAAAQKKKLLENGDEIRAKRRAYDAKNKDRFKVRVRSYKNKRFAEKFYSDPCFRLLHNMRNRLGHAMAGKAKSGGTVKLLGCSAPFLRDYIESRFLPGMTWENRRMWHVDHIRPCASFDLTDPAQQIACFHYTNLQPLWATDNIKKNDKIAA
jgi:hypothetical protein